MSSYKFRVLLDNSNNEEIFRDILISESNTFSDFYNCILKAFRFNGDQLASFYISNNTWDKGDEISLMDMGDAGLNMDSTLLKEVIEDEDQKFILVYDFLKMWCFLIELVEVRKEKIERPEVILSIGIAPKEESREVDVNEGFETPSDDLGSEFDDIFNEFDDEEDFGGFENIDDYDI
jgi:hypothetical protein